MSWIKVCECLSAPTSTDSDVHPLHLHLSLHFSIPHTTQTERAQWAGREQKYSWNLIQIYKINGKRNNKEGVIQFQYNHSQAQRNKTQLCYHWCLYPARKRLTHSDTYLSTMGNYCQLAHSFIAITPKRLPPLSVWMRISLEMLFRYMGLTDQTQFCN